MGGELGGVACDGQSALPPPVPSPTGSPHSRVLALSPEPATRWRPMGGPCASRIDFPGAEFIPAAAASGICGALESGTERERELCRADPKRASTTPHRPLGSASPARVCAVCPPSFPPRHTPELNTESRAHGSEVAETLEGGRAPLGVLARPGILRHQQACLCVRVRVQGPPSHLYLKRAPPRVWGAVAHNFELVRGVRTANALIRRGGTGFQTPPRVRAELQRCHLHPAPLLPGF